ncbi:MAG: glycerate kinase [Verrucomicrobiales bacterium]|nr:glycerate kinase [Verrucomicrobiales bacterium]
MRVLIAPDKFKGTLTAEEAGKAMARGWRRVRRQDRLDLLPISDGGDGFGSLLGRHLGAETQIVPTVDAAGRSIQATWWWEPVQRLAIIESAAVIGLAMLPAGRFHPYELDTLGLGTVLREVASRRPRRCLVGVGGSATNDAGFGLARGIGWRFLDAAGGKITRWTGLDHLARIVPPKRRHWFRELVVAVDVRNRLLGPRGATRIYGPQKGIRLEEVVPAERCLRRLARFCNGLGHPGGNPSSLPGSGAAGGLGFGLAAFAGAQIESGFDLFARELRLEARLRDVDLVITGEGALDLTSVAMGKGVGRLARLCRAARIPCLGLAGVVGDGPQVRRAFTEARGLTPDLTTPEQALGQASRWLARLAEQAARDWKSGGAV